MLGSGAAVSQKVFSRHVLPLSVERVSSTYNNKLADETGDQEVFSRGPS